MRQISFALTTDQIRRKAKTVTRRLGWKNLKAATHLMAVVKSQGLKKGEKVEKLGEIEVVSVRSEPLWHVNRDDEVAREGFPEMSIGDFVKMFCDHNGCKPETIITRIEFRIL